MIGSRRAFLCYTRALACVLCVCAAQVHAQADRNGTTELSTVAAEKERALDLKKRSGELAARGQYEQAIELDERALILARAQYGPSHAYVGFILDDLAALNDRLQRFEAATGLSREAVDIMADARGRDSIDYATMLRRMASIDAHKGDYRQATPLFETAYAIVAKRNGRDAEFSAQLARDVGLSYLELSQFDKAATWFAEALRANRVMHGENSVETALAYLDLAQAHVSAELLPQATNEALTAQRILASQQAVDASKLAQADYTLAQIDISNSRLDAAKKRLDKALLLADSTGSTDSPIRALILYKLGWVALLRRQAVEAERIYTETLAIYRRTLGDDSPMVGRVAHCLAIVYQDLGQFEQSERYYGRAIDIFTTRLGANDPQVAATRLEYSSLLSEGRRTDEAIEQAHAALAIYDSLHGQWDLTRGYASADLALAQHRAGDLTGAERTYGEALALMTRVRGAQSSDLPPGLTDLASIFRQQSRLDDADRALNQAIGIRRKDNASTPAGLAESLSELARLRLAQGRPQEALAASREAVGIARRRLDVARQSLSAAAIGEERRGRGLFEAFLEVGVANGPLANDALLREMFEVAQLPHVSGTSGAVSQMAVRVSAGDSELKSVVRERQDAVEQWRALDRTVVDSLSQARIVESSPAKEQQDRAALARLNMKIEQLDDQLRNQYPGYAELTNPGAVPASAVQSLLAEDEALFLQVTSSKATYVFLVTRDALDFARTDMTAHQLGEAVDSIRAGLDFSRIRAGAAPPVFDVANAYLLYRSLFLPFESELKTVRHIVAVVDKRMQSLPLSLLLTEPATNPPNVSADYRSLNFFVRRFAFSIEPSVSSFVSLRSVARRSQAHKPFVGFGDPVLTGTGTTARGVLNDALVTNVDPSMLRTTLKPLPDTRTELTAIAKALHASTADLYFGARATKPVVMQTDLAQFRIVSFATHALVAGNFEGQAEPALVLTPPRVAAPKDNGLLSASDVATLKLDADWVLLSACNTAAPEGPVGAEGLSGLAKAFLYAGSRALLVSHWSVNSAATVELMTRAMQTLVARPEIGRAEALRRAMLSLLDDERNPKFAHPIFWAPFFNVGEGGRMQ
ncbi:tetratricopeptide repeat protein [Paraburkholderia sp. BL6669N2]|uniref:CHAT domain-containing tetratricopeptide repeat protein n=1 Tax=Paraburkholderia sp. BL6669N2 TaxID=1938807 RepID=UPI000E36C9A3|nr:tetratricopeptide repeat protein [Paraburkholderia sp. BL6669N2]REG48605.1 tetratricopeptide repeat protein [Paraburkholderia sp. BL6669N2]